MKNIFGTKETTSKIEMPSIENTYKIELEKKLKLDIEEMGYNVIKTSAELDLEKGIITEINLSVNKNKKKEKENIDVSINKIEIRKYKRGKYLK